MGEKKTAKMDGKNDVFVRVCRILRSLLIWKALESLFVTPGSCPSNGISSAAHKLNVEMFFTIPAHSPMQNVKNV